LGKNTQVWPNPPTVEGEIGGAINKSIKTKGKADNNDNDDPF
jgi:hypothetical protein